MKSGAAVREHPAPGHPMMEHRMTGYGLTKLTDFIKIAAVLFCVSYADQSHAQMRPPTQDVVIDGCLLRTGRVTVDLSTVTGFGFGLFSTKEYPNPTPAALTIMTDGGTLEGGHIVQTDRDRIETAWQQCRNGPTKVETAR